MGMDAKAYIFYGYRDPVEITEEDVENYAGLCIFDHQENQYLFVCDSYQSFDWDYGAQTVDPQQMYSDEENNSYFRQVRDFVREELDEYSISKIGWIILCDISY